MNSSCIKSDELRDSAHTNALTHSTFRTFHIPRAHTRTFRTCVFRMSTLRMSTHTPHIPRPHAHLSTGRVWARYLSTFPLIFMHGWREPVAIIYICRHVRANTSRHGTHAFRSAVHRAATRSGNPQEISHRRGAWPHFRHQSATDRHARALRQNEAARPSAHRGGRSAIPLFTGWCEVPCIHRNAPSRPGT